MLKLRSCMSAHTLGDAVETSEGGGAHGEVENSVTVVRILAAANS